MKKILRNTVITVFSIIGILLLLGLFYFFRMQSELKKMAPLPTKNITGGIYSINNKFVNLYILKTSDKYIAIDTGVMPDMTKIEMQKISLDPARVCAVFLTHTDRDHVAGVKLFPNAKVYISKEEEQMINGKTPRKSKFHNILGVPYVTLQDNEVVEVSGLSVKALLTPGHTPGSTCYLIDNKFLFTGDTLGLQARKATLFTKFFNMDSKKEAESIRNLAKLVGVSCVLTGHFGYTENFRKAFEDWQ